MEEEKQEIVLVSDMVRKTAENSHEFLSHVANHIEILENTIESLQAEIAELKNHNNEA